MAENTEGLLRDAIKRGEELLKRKQQMAATDWEEWNTIAAGLAAGRALAMHQACSNRPQGQRYSRIFSAWLKESHYSTLDQDTRAALLRCHEQADAIERWRREVLTTSQQLRLNHPRSVWRCYLKWRRQGSEPKPEKKQAGSKTREQQLVLDLMERTQQRDAALSRAEDAERRLQDLVQEKEWLSAENARLRTEITTLNSQFATQADDRHNEFLTESAHDVSTLEDIEELHAEVNVSDFYAQSSRLASLSCFGQKAKKA